MTNTTGGLNKAHEKRRAEGASTRKIVLDIVRSAKEPITIAEIRAAIRAERGRSITSSHIHKLLQGMQDTGAVFSRQETPEEIKVRGAVAYNFGSHLYWAGGPTVPTRTMKTVLMIKPNVTLPKTRPAKKTKKQTGASPKSAKKSAVRPGRLVAQTDSRLGVEWDLGTDTSIAENMRLRLRVIELEAQLATLRKLLG